MPPCCCANHCVLNSESLLKIVSHPPKHLRRCKVKPHGSLVPVSSTHRCARRERAVSWASRRRGH
ncbi:hypothetical protein DOL97_17160 [Salmonella enterica subsp. enterica serovar Derby]|nr:hypothetical protein DOL97_17160 [Salmonella enterica subsp. enterica serovar Derby]